ncbi:MAG: UDP-N-acetylmuramoyl-L-alanyl-D-glutamate--2,6-diaminopimelate ligase [Deltaproteobacteria bacterium]|nr:UDP-N-acetylmuramoyl-L-alanyl-D-glutamate--2,6-diaminopimelate ligase [Deltaproteobacteria bacterium]
MRLKELIHSLDCAAAGLKDAEVEITGISSDSKEVSPGFLFVAMKGVKRDGGEFIKDAIEKGAVCVVTEKEAAGGMDDVPRIIVKDARGVIGRLSDRFYGEPSKKLKLVGVTGTNGKTTVTYLVEAIFAEAGLSGGVIGTVNYRYAGKVSAAPHTTPEAPALQRLLRDMVASGVTHCAVEVSSHSLEQKRVDGTRFDVKVFTNLTPEHLDYHRTMEAYFNAKARFFTECASDSSRGISIINVDDGWGAVLQKEVKPSLRYSMGKNADIYPTAYSITGDGIEAAVHTPRGEVSVKSPLTGEHNLYNILAAVGAACVLGIGLDCIERGVAAFKGVPGRLERVGSGTPRAYVDYAHTPDALERTLKVMTAATDISNGGRVGRLITVFGCGGNRDRLKRPLMGGISAKLSDVTVLTSDNPRDEDPLDIIKEIEKGMEGVKKYAPNEPVADKGYFVIPDRAEAIKKAVEIAGRPDTILLAGKGHEDYQIIKNRRFPFDDREVLRGFLKEARGSHSSGRPAGVNGRGPNGVKK